MTTRLVITDYHRIRCHDTQLSSPAICIISNATYVKLWNTWDINYSYRENLERSEQTVERNWLKCWKVVA